LISVSIVSHGQGKLIENLVRQLLECSEVAHIIITVNISESSRLPSHERITVIHNAVALGFGENHNRAFDLCEEPFYLILNPDIELPSNPFPCLLRALEASNSSLVAPRVVTPKGQIEPSARRFPTISLLIRKLLFGYQGSYKSEGIFSPDWVGGMFMLFRSSDFKSLGGFDKRFYMYYEDVDICARARAAQMRITVATDVKVVHDARRASHRELRHAYWHLRSMLIYFARYLGGYSAGSLR
jgi:N-acetylglucosaminyl-diphospho-decaprenol L-rhamnosyltransferase